MSNLSGTNLAGRRVAVVGAGAVGLVLSVQLARRGVQTILFDPADARREASGVAAGMLAPAGEALFDGLRHLPLWRKAAGVWAEFAASVPGLDVASCGARFSGLENLSERLNLGASLADAAPPRSEEDARLEPVLALAALEQAFDYTGGMWRRERLEQPPPDADITIIAAGFESRRLSHLAPELAALIPIKGQLLRFKGGPAEGPILRSPQGYLVPSRHGAVVGATMEPGLSDRDVTDAARIQLLAIADDLLPGLSKAPHQMLAGVRAATPDGLPMVGPSVNKDVLIATGMRRNGWLLAPLVSEMILAYLSGGEVGPFAAALDPRRFART